MRSGHLRMCSDLYCSAGSVLHLRALPYTLPELIHSSHRHCLVLQRGLQMILGRCEFHGALAGASTFILSTVFCVGGRDFRNAARVIGDPVLHQKMDEVRPPASR